MTDADAVPDLTAFLDAAAETDRLRALHQRLAARADLGADLDLMYRTVESPVGELLLAATSAGLCRVAFAREDHDAVIDDLARLIGARVLRNPARFDGLARELEVYFTGRPTDFTVPVDLRLAHGYRRRVLEELRRIGYGHTRSYGQVAAACGNVGAARATGTACATNPVPLVVPCHRVVRSGGQIGAYRGGTAAKQYLLALESGLPDAKPPADAEPGAGGR